MGGSFAVCKVENCDIPGMTIDGIDVKEALEFYRKHLKICKCKEYCDK